MLLSYIQGDTVLNQSRNTGHYQCLTSLLRGRPDGTATKIRIQFILCCLSGLYCRTGLGGQLMGGAAVQQLAWLGNASLLLLLDHHLYYLPHPASNATVRVTEGGSAGRVQHCRLARPSPPLALWPAPTGDLAAFTSLQGAVPSLLVVALPGLQRWQVMSPSAGKARPAAVRWAGPAKLGVRSVSCTAESGAELRCAAGGTRAPPRCCTVSAPPRTPPAGPAAWWRGSRAGWAGGAALLPGCRPAPPRSSAATSGGW